MIKNTFKKEERLCSKKDIDFLFQQGSSFFLYPFRVVFLSRPVQKDDKFSISVLFSVPKRKFPSAVVRNLIKRRMREVYRFHKPLLYAQFAEINELVDENISQTHINTPDKTRHLLLAIQYTSKEIEDFSTLNVKMQQLGSKLLNEYHTVYLGEDH